MRLPFRFLPTLCAISVSLLAPSPVSASPASTVQEEVIASLSRHYVFPDRIPAIRSALDKAAEGGRFDSASPQDLANLLTQSLVDASSDLHFAVIYDPAQAAALASHAQVANIEDDKARNFGFRAAQVLDGNLGYVRLDYFADPQTGYATAAAAMRMVANADALIIDLRYNNGGVLEMAQLLASYLFTGETDELLFRYYYNRDGDRIDRSQWVLPAVDGQRMPDVPVVVLTGSTSFSSAEWFSVAMRETGRATLIGETTSGGAHPVDRFALNDSFVIQIPIGEIRGPLGKTDFEGTGVTPDILVPGHLALERAQVLLLEELEQAKQSTGRSWALQAARDRLAPTARSWTADAVGKYEGREIVREGDAFVYRWRDRLTLHLLPVARDTFAVDGISDYRMVLERKGGRVVGLKRVMSDGASFIYPRL